VGAGEGWAAPFEALLVAPNREALQQAALTLLEWEDARPAGASPAALRALAGRLAMASLDQEGELQQQLARLARGLKALA
jgi:hypothetical protein